MNRELNNGEKIPVVGLGTWTLKDGVLLNALECAYEAGYRHIDTASRYHNEKTIGEFLGRKNRDEFFVTSKLWDDDGDNVSSALDATLENLGIACLDLYLVHWPTNSKGDFDLEKLWRQMESCVAEKKTRSIGVSNFGIKNLTKLLSFCKIKPVVDQVELHPYLPQTELRRFCDENSIQIVCYSPLGSYSSGQESVRNDPAVLELAKKYSVSSAQIILSFLAGEGYCVIPRSSSKKHIRENFVLIELAETDRVRMQSIKRRVKYIDLVEKGPNRFD